MVKKSKNLVKFQKILFVHFFCKYFMFARKKCNFLSFSSSPVHPFSESRGVPLSVTKDRQKSLCQILDKRNMRRRKRRKGKKGGKGGGRHTGTRTSQPIDCIGLGSIQ